MNNTSQPRPGAMSRLVVSGRPSRWPDDRKVACLPGYFADITSVTTLEKVFIPAPRSRNCSYFKRSAGT